MPMSVLHSTARAVQHTRMVLCEVSTAQYRSCGTAYPYGARHESKPLLEVQPWYHQTRAQYRTSRS
eukprot:930843-Rhodomonas_salina.1